LIRRRGGDVLLWQNVFWFYSHPAVYIMVLPGFGVLSEVLSTHSRKPIFGYRMIALSSHGDCAGGLHRVGASYVHQSDSLNCAFRS
jgi:cytochrome c oxidase subunit I